MGHYSTQCKAPKKKEEAHLAQIDDSEPALLFTESEENPRQELVLLNEDKVRPELHQTDQGPSSAVTWYLDNGASNHMTGDKEKFQELDETIAGKVRFGDGRSVEIKGKGSIIFSCKNGEQWTLEGVYYIPSLCSNMISLGQLTETGHKVIMDIDELEVFAKSPLQLIMKVRRSQNRLYKVKLHLAIPTCFLGKLEEPAWLWHARFGHVNFQSLKKIADKEMVMGVPSFKHPHQLCHSCLVAKQSRESFPAKTSYRADAPLELLHADLCGPITPATIGENHYFMLIVDDYSRWMWVNILRTKDQTLPVFTKFKTLVENMRGCRIKTLRTDRGGEFLSANFTKLCEETGIERHYTAPYSPQQNGVVERRNRSIMDMTRSLLKSMNLPGRFWGEAVRHAVYLLNRLPTKAMGDRTPFEAWYRKKPHVGHLRVFGCTAHAKVTTPHLKKLDDRSHMMIYLGVEDGSKAHRLYDPRENKIQVSRDVKFEENR